MSEDLQRIQEAYRDYDREVTLGKFKIGCVLGIILVPSFAFLDFLFYREFAAHFLWLRFLNSALIGVFLAVLLTPFGRRHYRVFGVILVLIPAALISYMIYATEGKGSPYYAGLNLVLLTLGFVVNWTVRESLTAVSLVVALYLAACFLPGAGNGYPQEPSRPHTLVNNLFFLTMTGVIVVTGTHYLSRWRFREFGLRFQLDADRRKLEETNRKLLELDQLKSQFFANVSHELRTPLTLLLAPLDALLHHQSEDLSPETRQLLTTMQSNGLRLLRLINDLLDLVRLESGRTRVQPEPLELEVFVRGLVDTLRHTAGARSLELNVELQPNLGTALLDRDKLEKILLNLLFNALKFTPPGGRVQLRLRAVKDQLVFWITDTGPGIAASHLPRIFDRFYQADGSTSRQHQGLGIGLALVKELTEIQGGTVHALSQEGQGSTFTVHLPYLKPGPDTPPAPAPGLAPEDTLGNTQIATQAPEWLTGLYHRAKWSTSPIPALPNASQPVSNGRAVILVADDEPDMRRFIASQLQREFTVLEAADGTEAVSQATTNTPDLLVLDLMMPGKDGLQTCRELRAHPATRSLPIILLTARADEETKLAALGVGANDFLTKPFSTLELKLRVRSQIENHQLQKELTRQNELLQTTIEQLKDTEVQLIQAEKLASLGRLSAGIIHEINNPLNFATTNLFALRRSCEQTDPALRNGLAELVNDVDEGLRRVRDIVVNLRSFTHPGSGLAEEVTLGVVVEAALRFLSHELREEIQIQVSLPPDLVALAERNRLLQVFVNLLQNSVDAFKHRPASAPPAEIHITGRREGDHVLVTVRDNGPGIDPAIQDKIFDPFFTTKEIGEGLGLGLAISYRILQTTGGHLQVRSVPGEFTEMILRLPAAPTPPSP